MTVQEVRRRYGLPLALADARIEDVIREVFSGWSETRPRLFVLVRVRDWRVMSVTEIPETADPYLSDREVNACVRSAAGRAASDMGEKLGRRDRGLVPVSDRAVADYIGLGVGGNLLDTEGPGRGLLLARRCKAYGLWKAVPAREATVKPQAEAKEEAPRRIRAPSFMRLHKPRPDYRPSRPEVVSMSGDDRHTVFEIRLAAADARHIGIHPTVRLQVVVVSEPEDAAPSGVVELSVVNQDGSEAPRLFWAFPADEWPEQQALALASPENAALMLLEFQGTAVNL